MNLDQVNENTAVRLWCFTPSVVEPGEEFDIKIQAWDKWEQLAIQYDQEITLYDYIVENESLGAIEKNTDDKSYSFPENLKFKPSLIPKTYLSPEYYPKINNDRGCLKVSKITLDKEGVHYIKVESSDGLYTYSNPILVDNDPKYKLYWGDLHCHTDYSDGTGTPEFAFYYAREVACLDFASVTDHDILMSTVHLGTYQLDKSAANRYNDDEDFVTFVAYEWTSFGRGHINVYYKNDDGPMFSAHQTEYDDPLKLLDALKEWKEEDSERDVIAIPHHPTSSGNYYDWSYDWRDIDPDLMPLVEVYSVHGSAEMTEEDGNQYPLNYFKGQYYDLGEGYNVQSALEMGYRIGLMSSADTHDARLGHSLTHIDNYGTNYPFSTFEFFRASMPFPGGLAACWSEELTREEIFESFKSRRVYATTHVSRPFVQFSINDVSPGTDESTVIVSNSTSNRHIIVEVAIDGNYPDNAIKSVEIVKNNKNWVVYDSDGLYYGNGTKISDDGISDRSYLKIDVNDTEPIEGMRFDNGEYEKGKGYKITDNADMYFDEKPSTEGVDVYYIRVTDTFNAENWGWTCDWYGNQAWVGPIWVQCA